MLANTTLETVESQIKKLSTEELFRTKSKAMALNLLDECYSVVTNRDLIAPFSAKLEMLKVAAKFGDLEPKENLLPQGVGFSIKIVYSSGRAAGAVVDGELVGEIAAPPGFMSLTPSFITSELALLDQEAEDA